ncbi:MAG TPA: ABC transporter ATP-binding protein [Nitrososphaerales archaeon]|nr:ABC transporter ATP-binding protein [Nitrososphaerales archaeon]
MVEIKVEGLTKKYGKVEVLNNVSFVAGDGELAVLLGPSGCGKTTLLRCVAGLESVDKGEIYIGDELVNPLPPRERDLSMVFQGFSLFPTMNVHENIAFPLRVRGVATRTADERVNEVAKLLGIEQLLDKSPKEISGGEQQRVAIGRAIARKPNAFLMDEPLSSLDAPLRAQLRSELKRLQREIGITTLYVTHDQAEALALADKIGVMNKGSLLQYGSPQSVFERPSSAFVARFVGDPQANILNVSLATGLAGAHFVEAAGLRFAIPATMGAALDERSREKGAVTGIQVSIRPEDIELAVSRTSEEATEGRVLLDEPLTLYRLVTVKLEDGTPDGTLTNVKVLASKDLKLAAGQQVWLRIKPERVHFFDRETGELLV